VEDMDEIVAEFLVESHENLDQLDQDLVALEREPGSRALLSSIFRTVHTIKGTSGFLAFNTLESVTHVGESLLSRLRDGEMALTPQLTTVLLEMVDAVRSLLASIEESGTEGEMDYSELVAGLHAVLERAHQGVTDPTSTDSATATDYATSTDTTSTDDHVEAADSVPAGEVAGELLLGELLLGELLVERGMGADDLTIALTEQDVGDHRPLGEILVDDGAVTSDEVSDALQSQAGGARRSVADSSIRVDVDLLDGLMNLVGELVLTRNQLLQRAATRQDPELQRTAHRLNLIAGELQEGVMKTRMQPIESVWNKLPRVVRDLCVGLGKSVRVEMEGRDTELDKTILEAVKDPLTHLVRNSVDHGVETPSVRIAAGKPAEGRLLLRAFHKGGQVNIEIIDDGAGIDPGKLRAKAVSRGMMTPEAAEEIGDREALHLIFHPGFSTAAAVTNVSGRGVGMDVVKTNIEKIGGTIDVISTVGQGTTVRIKIPLTLAIIPALVISAADNLYAIPQVNLLELVRLEGEQALARIETIQGTPVCRLRGLLLPLVDLREQLGLAPRQQETTLIVVLQADGRQFGLVVDEIKDTEEIVVKPLGKQLRGIALYAGATIMGDGRVALILDANALAHQAGMTSDSTGPSNTASTTTTDVERSALLVLGLSDGRRVALPLGAVDRLEQFPQERFERVGGHEVVQYRGEILPLVRLDRALQSFGEPADADPIQVVVCQHKGRLVGFIVAEIHDIVEDELAVRTHLDTGGHQGSAVVGGHVTELIDVERAVSAIDPELLAPVAVS
jgi:two-component system, chemotaxis family, sensor kinase CheA